MRYIPSRPGREDVVVARIARVGHVVLSVKDTREAIAWYTSALGMELMAHDQDMDLAFLSFGTLDHDIGLIKAPEGIVTGSSGLSHTALLIEGGESELRELFGRVKRAGGEIDFTADHGLTKSFYCFDPSGNRIEVFCQQLHGEEARSYMREHGAVLDPYQLEPAGTDQEPSMGRPTGVKHPAV